MPFYTDPAQMMDEVKPEAAIIATPTTCIWALPASL